MKSFIRRFLRHPGGIIGLPIVLLFLLVGCLSPWLLRGVDPGAVNLAATSELPTAQHPLGTEGMGRDVVQQLIAGAPLSLMIAVISVLVALLPGVVIGLFAGYYEAPWASWLMRVVDAMVAFPRILQAIVIISIAGQGAGPLMVAVGVASIPIFARVMYATVQSLREREYVQSAIALGARDGRILLRHILPNALAPLLVQASLGIATSLQIAAGLSFLGLGPPPPTPEWGALIDSGRSLITQQPFVILAPGTAIALTVLGFNLMGDGLRDTLDPRLKL